MWRDLALGLSLANLCCLRIWSGLLGLSPEVQFSLKSSPSMAHVSGAVTILLVLGILLTAAVRQARNRSSGSCRVLALAVLTGFGLVAANGLRIVVLSRFPLLRDAVVGPFGVDAWGLLHLGIIGLAAGGAILAGRRTVRALTAALLVLSPLVFLNVSAAAWSAARLEARGFADGPLAGPVREPAASGRRVVWLLFDEWDYELSFVKGSESRPLPNLNRLRGESLDAAQAYAPANDTLLSVPALLTGKPVGRTTGAGPGDLWIRTLAPSATVRFSTQLDVFARARAMGFNTAVAGWYLPYCRIFSSRLSACLWEPIAVHHGNLSHGVAAGRLDEIARAQFRLLFETPTLSPFGDPLPVEAHAAAFRSILGGALRYATDPGMGLVYVHFPVPHSPFLSRQGLRLSRGGLETAYGRSLQLLDWTVGEIRREMESAGVWERSSVILTSDHSLRARGGGRRVPFLLRLAGQRDPRPFTGRLSTIVTQELALRILAGRITTADGAAAWLDHGDPEGF